MNGSLGSNRSSRLPESGQLSTLLTEWLDHVTFPPAGTPIRCGVSGGADSLALLALGVASGCTVTAVHVDHGQRSSGSEEADRVDRACRAVGATFESVRVDVQTGSNLEARMRAARYDALGPDACTGHTADDQAETLIINLMRGTGLVGLGAMEPGVRRPILSLRRTDTVEICRRLGWDTFTDPSNDDPRFQRNRVRSELIPLLNDVASRDVVPLLARSAMHAREAAIEFARQAAQLDPTDAKALAEAPPPVAAVAVQQWIRRATGDQHPIDSAAVGRVLDVARGEFVAAEVTGGWRISRSQQRLSLAASDARQYSEE